MPGIRERVALPALCPGSESEYHCPLYARDQRASSIARSMHQRASSIARSMHQTASSIPCSMHDRASSIARSMHERASSIARSMPGIRDPVALPALCPGPRKRAGFAGCNIDLTDAAIAKPRYLRGQNRCRRCCKCFDVLRHFVGYRLFVSLHRSWYFPFFTVHSI